nr:putative membrane protein [Quercus suber]
MSELCSVVSSTVFIAEDETIGKDMESETVSQLIQCQKISSMTSVKMDDTGILASTVNARPPTFARKNEDLQNLGKGPYLTTGYLPAPLSGPIRPLSPDTLSTFSADEYEQIRPTRTTQAETFSRIRDASFSPAPLPRGWRARLEASWVRNKVVCNGTCGKDNNKSNPFRYWRKTPHFPFGLKEVRWLLVARGFFGFFGVVGMYWSLLYLPLADATVITFLSPAIACFACSILLKEPFTRLERIAALVSLVGVVLIARPTSLFGSSHSTSDNVPTSGNGDGVADVNKPASASDSDASNYENVTSEERLFAVGIALVGVLGAAVVITIIRWIGKRAHPLISVNYFATWCTFTSLLAQLTVPGVGFLLPADLRDWALLFALGTCGFIMQFFLAAGLSYEKSSRATNITYTQMLFALGVDKLIFGHTPGTISIIGSSLILGAAIVVAMQQSSVSKARPGSDDLESRRGLTDSVGDELPVENGGQLQMQMQDQDLQLGRLR